MHLGIAALKRCGDGDDATACAHVPQPPALRQVLHHSFHQQFGFRPWYQYRRRDLEHAPIKFALTQQIRHGHAIDARLLHVVELPHHHFWQLLIVVSDQMRAGKITHTLQQHAGFKFG